MAKHLTLADVSAQTGWSRDESLRALVTMRAHGLTEHAIERAVAKCAEQQVPLAVYLGALDLVMAGEPAGVLTLDGRSWAVEIVEVGV